MPPTEHQPASGIEGPDDTPGNSAAADGRQAARAPSASEPDRFSDAFLTLMSRAPGPVFPRARRLYFNKYPLESTEDNTAFRTFLLEETIAEGSDGSLQIEARALALVPWDPQRHQAAVPERLETGDAERYLKEHWQRTSMEIRPVEGPWFRSESPYLWVAISAIYRSGGGVSSSLSRAGH
ncbi:MAG: hypothetical protein ACKOCM_12150 [Cyanobacteriota bacterium]